MDKIPEKTNPARRSFIGSIGKILCIGFVTVTAGWGLSLVQPHQIIHDCTRPSQYKSLSEAIEDLDYARDWVMGMPRYSIIGRVKSMTPEKPSIDELVKLVLTDGTNDMGFYICRGSTGAGIPTGLFCDTDKDFDKEYYDSVVMYNLRSTKIGDEVEVATNPALGAKGHYYIAREFRKRSI